MKFKNHAVRIIAAFIIFLCATVSTAFAQPVPGFSKTAPLSGTGTAANPLKLNVCGSGSGYVSDGTSMVCSPISGGGVSGTGTVNTVAKWSSTSAVGNSLLADNATTLSYNAGKFTVDSATGNTAVLGTLTENTRRVFSAVGTGLARDATNAYQVNLAMTAQSCSVGQALTSATAVGVFACGSAVASVAAGTGISVGTSSGIATVTLNMTAQTCGAGTLLSSASAVGVFACSSAITSVSAPLSSASGVATLALCSANQVLQMNAGATAWACAATVTGTVTGTGTSGTSTRWTGTSAIGNGALSDNGTQLGLGTSAVSTYFLDVLKALGGVNGTAVRIRATGGSTSGSNVALEVGTTGGSAQSDIAINATGKVNVAGDLSVTGGGSYFVSGALASAIACSTTNQVPTWNGSSWACAIPTGQTYTAGTGISIASNVVTLAMSALSCSAGQHLATVTATGTFTCTADTNPISGLTTNTIPKASSATAIANSLLTDNATTLSYNSGSFTANTSGNVSATGSITASANLSAGGFITTSANSIYMDTAGALYLSHNGTQNSFGGAYGTNATADVWFNAVGFGEGITQFRNFKIGDGKGVAAVTITGSTKGAAFGGPVDVSGLLSPTTTQIQSNGWLKVKGNTPSTSSCGTGATISGDNTAMLLTLGTGTVSPCVITFPVTFTNEPVCTVETESSTKTFSYSKTATALTLTSGTVSAKYDIICVGIY